MQQEIAAVPASHFGLHLSDEAHPAARGYVRDDLTREGALRVPELPRGWHFAPRRMTGSPAGGIGAVQNRSLSPDPRVWAKRPRCSHFAQ